MEEEEEVSYISDTPTAATSGPERKVSETSNISAVTGSAGTFVPSSVGTTTAPTEAASDTETERGSDALTDVGISINTNTRDLSAAKDPSVTSEISKPERPDVQPIYNEWTREPSEGTTGTNFTKASEDITIPKLWSESGRASDRDLTIQEEQEPDIITIVTEFSEDDTAHVKNAGAQIDGVINEDDNYNEQTLWVDDLVFPDTDEEVQRAKNLFTTVIDSERIRMMKFSSMLISGFGLRNYPSLCRALQYQQQLDEDYKRRKHMEEEAELARLKRLHELEPYQHGEYKGESASSFSNLGSQTDFSSISASTHQDTTAEQRRRIEYLMGLHTNDGGWEEDAGVSTTISMISELKSCGPEKEELLTGTSDAMRQAQQYLRTHHIFEFFQFLIVHLLSKVPENPIEYLLLLLDRMLIYRSGLGMAPLHYKKRHLEQLFYLMDRMRTGFIDYQQYKTGMNTIGIRCFNSNPPLNNEGQLSKEFFLEEAYQCSCYVLNNIIRARKVHRNVKKGHPQYTSVGFTLGARRS